MSFACVLITHLPAKSELLRKPGLKDKPVIIVARATSSGIVMDATPELKKVFEGMPLREALPNCPIQTVLIEADIEHYERRFDEIAESMLRISPMIEKSDLGRIYIDMSSVKPDSNQGDRARENILDSIPNEFNPRIGLSKTKFSAYLAATQSKPGQTVTFSGDATSFIQKLPVGLLPVSQNVKFSLRNFGIYTIGQVSSLGISALQAQFGQEGKTAWEVSNSADTNIITPIKQSLCVNEYLSFPVPATTTHTICSAIEILFGKALNNPTIKGRYIRSASIKSSILNRATWSKKFVFKTPVNTVKNAMASVKSIFTNSTIPGPFEDVNLTVSDIVGEFGKQTGFFADVKRNEHLAEMMKQLEVRLCQKPPVYKIIEVNPWSRIPEKRKALIQFSP